MRTADFFSRLVKENKIQLVEPSVDVKTAYFERSAESLGSAKVLFNIGNLKDAVALTYYSMYYSLLALLFRVGIKCENHTAAIVLLKELFGIDNGNIRNAKKERVDKQYYVDFTVTKDEVTDLVKTAEDFNAQLLDFAEKIGQEDVVKYRRLASELLNKR